jgi:hypothetical protein
VAQQVFVDSGYMAEVVYGFCREGGERFRPAVGRGAAQQRRQWYNRPTQTGSTVKRLPRELDALQAAAPGGGGQRPLEELGA